MGTWHRTYARLRDRARWKPLAFGAASLLLLGVVASASFAVTRLVTAESTVVAQAPGAGHSDTADAPLSDDDEGASELAEPEHMQHFREDEQHPIFDGEMSGIRIGPDVIRHIPECDGTDDAHERNADLSAAAGTPVELAPRYVPSGSEQHSTSVIRCGDAIVTTFIQYYVPDEPASGRIGGRVSILRTLGSYELALSLREYRTSEATIAGLPAATMRPITDDGWGDSAVVLREAWGLTIVQGMGLSMDEMRRIVEGVVTGDTP